jgi:hypothetical protein
LKQGNRNMFEATPAKEVSAAEETPSKLYNAFGLVALVQVDC